MLFGFDPSQKKAEIDVLSNGKIPTEGENKRWCLGWTKLLEGFTESPNLFGQALAAVLQLFPIAPEVKLIQYVDD